MTKNVAPADEARRDQAIAASGESIEVELHEQDELDEQGEINAASEPEPAGEEANAPVAEHVESESPYTSTEKAGGADPDADAGDAHEEATLSEADLVLQLREELAAAHALVEENVDKLQRTAAEFQNTRRRQDKQLADAIDRANGNLIRRLLPVLDDFDLAFQNAPAKERAHDDEAADQAWIDGFRQIQRKLLDLLEEEGVTPVDATGEFDPMRHEAVLSEESDEVESGHIIGVLRTGYEFRGQVLRPAMVRVAA